MSKRHLFRPSPCSSWITSSGGIQLPYPKDTKQSYAETHVGETGLSPTTSCNSPDIEANTEEDPPALVKP